MMAELTAHSPLARLLIAATIFLPLPHPSSPSVFDMVNDFKTMLTEKVLVASWL
jgi:hypothetical protein